MEGSGRVRWTENETPRDYSCYQNGRSFFTHYEENGVITSSVNFPGDEIAEANNFRRLGYYKNTHIVEILYSKRRKSTNETKYIVDQIGENFSDWVYRRSLNLNMWVMDPTQIIIGPGPDFLTVFKGIIDGLDQFIELEGFHGNIINGVTVLEDGNAKICWPGDAIHTNMVDALRGDFLGLCDLVILAAGAQYRIPYEQALATKYGWGNCLFLFHDMVTTLIRNCNTHEELKELWFFMKNNPLFHDDGDRYEMVRKIADFEESMELVDKHLKFKNRTSMPNWYSRIPSSSPLMCIGRNCKSRIQAQARPQPSQTGNNASVPLQYRPEISIFNFHCNAYEHVKDCINCRQFKDWSYLDVSRELFRIFPEFGPNFYYEFVMKIYLRTGAIDVNEVIRRMKEVPYAR